MSKCDQCNGFCCTREPFNSVRIEKREVVPLRKKGATVISLGYGVWEMPIGKTACIFSKNGRCSIYKKRPKACRDFDCAKSEAFQEFFKKHYPETYRKVFGK